MHLVNKNIYVQLKGEKLFVNNICKVNDLKKTKTIVLQNIKRIQQPI